MPRIDEVYPSQWLRAADLDKSPQTVTIDRVKVGEVGSGDERKTQLIVEFTEFDKPLGLNKTNAGRIGDIYGPDTDDWIGQRVVIFPTKVDYQGKQVDAIRIDKEETMEIFRAALKAAKPTRRPMPEQTAPLPARPAKPRATQPFTQEEVDADNDVPF